MSCSLSFCPPVLAKLGLLIVHVLNNVEKKKPLALIQTILKSVKSYCITRIQWAS